MPCRPFPMYLSILFSFWTLLLSCDLTKRFPLARIFSKQTHSHLSASETRPDDKDERNTQMHKTFFSTLHPLQNSLSKLSVTLYHPHRRLFAIRKEGKCLGLKLCERWFYFFTHPQVRPILSKAKVAFRLHLINPPSSAHQSQLTALRDDPLCQPGCM